MTNYSLSPAEAAQELIKRRQARRGMTRFAAYTDPMYQMNWHHALICDTLDRFIAGEIKKLMVWTPPQHGKSELVSRKAPAKIFGDNPNTKMIAASYAAELIQGMNRSVQRLMDSDEYRALYPTTSLNNNNVRTKSGSYLRNNDIFEIVGYKGQYRCAGVGGGLTGFPADVGSIDDPYKDYQEAMSATVRMAVQDWYSSVFLTRLHNDSSQLITQTRWHPMDLCGWLLSIEGETKDGGEWTVLRLPALADGTVDLMLGDPRENGSGEALWESRFSAATLQKRQKLNPRQFRALYQQDPKAATGSMFQIGEVQYVAQSPWMAQRVRRWDLAATDGGGDWTVGLLMARVGGTFYIEDYVAAQLAPHQRNRLIRETAAKDAAKYHNTVLIVGPQDPGAAGVESATHFHQMLAGYPVETERETGSKEVRAEPVSDSWEAGNIKVVRGDWNQQFLERIELFPHGGADEVDTLSGAYNRLALAYQGELDQEVVIYDQRATISSY